MGNKEQREFLASLRRPQINQLCLEMQTLISNFKQYLADTHGYTDEEISKIMRGTRYEDLGTTVQPDNTPPVSGKEPTAKKAHTKPQPTSQADLERLKREDEMIRRSMMFELEWCVAQIERGNYPS